MIQIKNITKKFGKLTVLDQVNLNFQAGQCIALIGPNGCGKTTLIKSVLGMVLPDSGSIEYHKKPIAREHQYRANIGYMPQIGRYPDHMTIGQIIEMIKKVRNQWTDLDQELIEAFGLEKMFDKPMRTLSGGTTQKVSAVLAFLFNPEILILDEPTAGLDPLASEILKEKIIKEKQRGKLILITSHLLNELDDLITEIIFMQDGSVQFHEKNNTLKQRTGEEKISKAIAKILKDNQHESNR
ncbi:MAG: ABC transporter ATP-binding protein [Bacteroidetes bacterium]|nr:ABC transporter ATP-binding protein [Bacteroidota bacterium]